MNKVVIVLLLMISHATQAMPESDCGDVNGKLMNAGDKIYIQDDVLVKKAEAFYTDRGIALGDIRDTKTFSALTGYTLECRAIVELSGQQSGKAAGDIIRVIKYSLVITNLQEKMLKHIKKENKKTQVKGVVYDATDKERSDFTDGKTA